jgi:hypothetical protein
MLQVLTYYHLLVVMSTRAELHRLFGITQRVGLDGAQWIQTARERCVATEDDLGWNWSESGNGLTYSVNLPKTGQLRLH